MQFGTWFTETEPRWKQALDKCHDIHLEELGLNRVNLEELLEKLEELGIVK